MLRFLKRIWCVFKWLFSENARDSFEDGVQLSVSLRKNLYQSRMKSQFNENFLRGMFDE